MHKKPKTKIFRWYKQLRISYAVKVCCLCLGVSICFADISKAQTGNRYQELSKESYLLKGTISDIKGIPMPGVTVMLQGTSFGCATDNEGKFSLSVPKEPGVLLISFIGYKTVRLSYKDNTPIKVKMEESTSELEEVTVVAYGKQSTREVTGSISTISADQINIPASNFTSLMQGLAPGVNVTRASNSPGGGGISTEIRGKSSLAVERDNRNSEPLYIVDGVPMYNNVSEATGQSAIADIDPKDILRVDILKDASSTSIYGSRAANGVILITTKKGGFGQKARVSANVSYSYVFNPPLPDQTGGNAERLHRLEALRNYQEARLDADKNQYVYIGSYEDAYKYKLNYDYFWNKGNIASVPALQDSLNPYYNNSTNIFKYYFQNAKTIDANLQVAGGSNNVAYFVSLGYYDEEGVLRNTGFGRLKLSSNLQIKPRENFKIDLSTDIVRTTRQRATMMGNNFPTGSFLEKIPSILTTYSSLMPGPSHPAFEAAVRAFDETKEKLESYRLRTNIGAAYQFLPGFELKSTFAIDFSQSNANTFYPSILDQYNESNSIGQVARHLSWINENMLTYKWTNEVHNVDVLLGASFQGDEDNTIKGWGKNAPSDLIQYVSWMSQVYDPETKRNLKDFYTYYTKSTLVGLFARVNYNYLQKYLFSATVRRDASSRFGEDVRWATFPSASIGYAFTQESFMEALKPVLSYGKLRASYGKSGRQFSQPYVSFGVLQPGKPFLGNPSIVPEWREGLQNRNLTWEECKQFDMGVDLEFFNRRVNVTFDYYYKYTDKILYNITLPGNYSAYNRQWQNAYAISNKGFELMIKWNAIRNDKLNWNLTFNFASNQNRLEKSNQNKDFQISSSDITENFLNNLNVVGKPINGIYAFPTGGIYQDDEEVPYVFQNGRKIYLYGSNLKQYYRAGDRIFIDTDGSGNIVVSRPSKEDRMYCGSPLPKLTGGINSALQWKNFDFTVNGFFSLGSHALNMRKGASVGTSLSNPVAPIFVDLDKMTFWEQPGDNSDYPANRAEAGLNNFATNIAANVEKVNYFKLKSLTVGYTFPKIKGVEAHLSLTGENLWTWTNYSGPDPETIDPLTGIDDLSNYPIGKVFRASLSVKF